jgi:RNA polymerase nonessential primary-like sigma factor
VLKGTRTTDLVRLYLQEIGRVRLLERHEEVAEAQCVQGYMQLLEDLTQAATEKGGIWLPTATCSKPAIACRRSWATAPP